MSIVHLHGYFGMKNLGDDLMLEALLTNISSFKKVICWMSKNTSKDEMLNWEFRFPKIVFKKYPKSFYVFPLLIYGKKIDKSVWVGGNCFYSHNNNQNLKWLFRLISYYQTLKVPFIFLGVGIGNYDSSGKELIEKILSVSNDLYFRDNSYIKFSQFCEQKAHTCGDLASLFSNKKIKTNSEKKGYIISGHKYFWKNERAIEAIQNAISQLDEQCYVLNFHQGNSGDRIFNQRISNVKYLPNLNIDETIQLFNSVKGIISFRLHSIILADILKVPNIAINYDPKIEAYFSRMNRSVDTLISVGKDFNPKILFEKWGIDENKIETDKASCREALKKIFH